MSNLIKTNVFFAFEGRELRLRNPVLTELNRYYIPLTSFVDFLGGKISLSENKFYIKLFNQLPLVLNPENLSKHYFINDEIYISLIDICRFFSLKSLWTYENSEVNLFINRAKYQNFCTTGGKRKALIRFEDICAGTPYIESENLLKLRIISDYMRQCSMPFHIAFIAHYKDPENSIDNNISKDFSIQNAHFLFTLEYLIKNGGVLGLHGYTHQYGNEVSGVGTEFNRFRNNTKNSIEKKMADLINTVSLLGLRHYFFETPHYSATAFQQSVFENYFNVIYEDYVGLWSNKITVSQRNGKTAYVPTPLGYMEGEENLPEVLSRIENIEDDALPSIFYHPLYEFDYIKIKKGYKGYPFYQYDKDSPLHKIINSMHEKGCVLCRVTDLCKNI